MDLHAQSVTRCLYCEESFACGVIFEKRRLPMTLTCGHNICSLCFLEVISQSVNLQCKKCSISYSHHDLIKNKFPICYYILGKSHSSQHGSIFKKLANINGEKNKETCFACNVVCKSKCQDCDKMFCLACFTKVHSLSDSLKSHVIDNKVIEHLDGHCNAHGYFGEHFCKTDLTYLCNLCIIDDSHVNHQVVGIEEVCSVNKEVDNSDIMEIACYQPVSSSSDINDQKENLQKVRNQIQAHCVDLCNKIQNMEDKLLEKLDSFNTQSEKTKLEGLSSPCGYRPVSSDIRFSFDDKIFNQLQTHCTVTSGKSIPFAKAFHDGLKFVSDEAIAKPLGSRERKKVPASGGEYSFYMEGGEIRNGPSKGSGVKTNRPSISSTKTGSDDHHGLVISAVRHVPHMNSMDSFPGQEIIHDEAVKSVGSEFSPNTPPSFSAGRGTVKVEDMEEVKTARLYNVVLTHTVNPSEFYVQKQIDSDKLKTVTEGIVSLIRSDHRMNHPYTPIVPGKLYLVRYVVDKMWYRGRCLHVVEKPGHLSVTIFFIDFGNTERCTPRWIRPIPSHLAAYPPFATCCRLYNVKPKDGINWSPEAVHSFCSNTSSILLKMRVFNDFQEVLEVDLLQNNSANNSTQSVRDLLILQELAELVNDDESWEEDDSDFVPTGKLRPGELFDAFVSNIQSPAMMYIQKAGIFSKALSDAMALLQSHFSNPDNSSLSLFKPSPGKPCACLHFEDMQWYRARVLEVMDSQVKVLYVDFGNREVVARHLLRPLTKDLMAMPVAAIPCSLYGVQPINKFEGWTKEAANNLNGWISKRRVKVRVESSIKEIYEIMLFECNDDFYTSLNNKLVKCNLAVSIVPSTSILTFTNLDELAPCEPHTSSSCLAEEAVPVKEDVEEMETEDVPTPLVRNKVEATPDTSGRYNSIQHFVCEARKSSLPIKVLRAITPGCFYVHFSDPELEESYRKLFGVLQEEYRNTESLPFHKWKVNDNCVCIHGKTWYRSKILEDKGSSVVVQLYDIGEECQVDIKDLRILVSHLGQRKPRVLCCFLDGISPAGDKNTWSKSATELLVENFQKHADNLYMLVKDSSVDGMLPVEVIAKEYIPCTALEPAKTEDISLSSTLIDSGLALRTNGKRAASNSDASPECATGVSKDTELENTIARQKDQYDFDGVTWLPALPFGDGQVEVIPTHVTDEGLIYFHLAAEGEENLKEIKETLSTVYDDSVPSDRDLYWLEDQPCIARYYLDNYWYRATIKKVDPGKITVQFIDYGNTEQIDSENLRKAMYQANLPVQAHQCKLYGVKGKCMGGTWNLKVLDLIQQLIAEKKCNLVVKVPARKSSPMLVTLTLPNKANLAELLVQMDMACPMDSATPEPHREEGEILDIEPDAEYKNNHLNDDVPDFPVVVTAFQRPNDIWIHVDVSANFSWPLSLIALKNQIQELSTLNNELNRQSKLFPSMDTFRAGSPCCVYSDMEGGWFRGTIVERVQDKVSAILVDYGSQVVVALDCVKKLPSKYLFLPIQAIHCRLNQVTSADGSDQPMSDRSAGLLEQCLMHNPRQLWLSVKNSIGVPKVDILSLNSYNFGRMCKTLAYQQLVQRGDISLVMEIYDIIS